METGFRVNTTFHLFLKFFFCFFSILWYLKTFFLFVFLSAAQTSPHEKERTQVTETKEEGEGAHTQRKHPSERLRSKNVKGKKIHNPVSQRL